MNITNFEKLISNPNYPVPYTVTLIQGKGSKVDVFTNTCRPSSAIPKGYQYYDSDINKAIYWTGTKWVDAVGVEVNSAT